MKFQCLLVLPLAILSLAQAPHEAPTRITKAQLQQLVAARMDSEQLAKTVQERGIDFEISGEDLETLEKSGAQPVLLRALGEVALERTRPPLDWILLRVLVVAGMSNDLLAKAAQEKGIDFERSPRYLQELKKAGAQEELLKALRELMRLPLSRDQVLDLVAGGVSSQRVASLVTQRGIDFKPKEEYLETLRIAGAEEVVLKALREARPELIFEEARTLAGHKSVVWSVAFGPDGRYVASGSGDFTVKLWEAATGREVRTLEGHSKWVSSVVFSPDGRYLASGSGDSTVRLWEVATGRELRTLVGHPGEVNSVAFSPDGGYLAAGGEATVSIWDVPSGRCVHKLGSLAKGISSVVYSPDGRYFAAAGLGKTFLWEVATWRKVRSVAGATALSRCSLAFSPDSRSLVCATSWTIDLWEVATGSELLRAQSDSVTSVVFSPDGRYLASGSADKTVKLWEVATGRELRTLAGHPAEVNSVAFSPDGRTLASACKDNTVRLWYRED